MSVSPPAGQDGFEFTRSLASAQNLNEFFLLGSRTDGATLNLYQYTTLVNTYDLGEVSPTVPTTKVCIGARGLTGDASADLFQQTTIKFVSFGAGLSQSQISTLYTAVAAYNTALGR